VGTTAHTSIRFPRPLREQLEAVARAERRPLSRVVVALVDRGLVARAEEARIVRDLVEELDAEVVDRKEP
jgi:hypothetical protein